MSFKTVILPIVFLATLLSDRVAAGGGGPDAFGYVWVDSDSSLVTYQWVDIIGRPDAVQVNSLRDDNQTGSIPIPFQFRYYWIDYQTVVIGSNGWISFANAANGNAHCFQVLPNPAPQSSNNTLAPFMCDLNFNSNYPTYPNVGECWYWVSPGLDSLVVTYKDVPFWKDDQFAQDPPDWIGANTFQIVLSRLDSSITFQYQHLDRDSMPMFASCASDVVVGIENATGQIGLTVYQEVVPRDSFAIRFIYPKEDTFEVKDAALDWQMGPGSKAVIIRKGQPLNLSSRISNVGNTAMDSAVVVHGKVLSIGSNLRWEERDTLSNLPLNGDTVIAFQDPFMINANGSYFFTTRLDNVEDFNGSNDLLSSEIVVVDSHPQIGILQYCLGGTTETSVSWPPGLSGDYGAGLYFKPPWDYYRVAAVQLFIVGNDANPSTPLPAGFRVDIFHEDSTGGLGQMYDSQLVTPSMAVEDGWNFVYPASSPQIHDRGFYVGWVQGGPGVGLGTETAGPKSRQTYEIIGSHWQPYRAQDAEDFLVRVEIEPLYVGSEPEKQPDDLPLDVWPNPASDRVQLQWEHPGGRVWVTVRDLRGVQLLQYKSVGLPSGKQIRELPIENWAEGVYFLELATEGRIGTQKLFVSGRSR